MENNPKTDETSPAAGMCAGGAVCTDQSENKNYILAASEKLDFALLSVFVYLS